MRGRIAIVQMDCVLGDTEANLSKIEKYTQAVSSSGAGDTLIVFPECATTGYFIADRIADLAEPVPGPTTDRLADLARKLNVWLVCGMVEADGDKYYDTSVLVAPDGLKGSYRKVHLFSAEKDVFTPGDRQALFSTPFGKLALTICYDLVFPEYIRSLVLAGADLIVNSTDWISDAYQRDVWGWSGKTTSALAATRALENTVYVAMANRVGREAGWDSLGYSCVASPSGSFLTLVEKGEGVAVTGISPGPEELGKWRSIASYLKDRRTGLYRQWGVTE